MNKMEYTYIDEHVISSSLICPICLDVLEDPYTHTACDSAFCRSCLLQLVEPVCPICRWHWDPFLPLEYNRQWLKANRLIRNMLDELLVRCVRCGTTHRRGQFEHKCSIVESPSLPHVQQREHTSMVFSMLIIFLLVLFIYFYRNVLFESAVDRQKELITGIGIDIDRYLFERGYYLLVQIMEYSFAILIWNLILWFSLVFYGDQLTSKTSSRILKKCLEVSIIITLITYSIYK